MEENHTTQEVEKLNTVKNFPNFRRCLSASIRYILRQCHVSESDLVCAGDMSATLVKIANNASMLRLNILFDMLTALGVIFLGAILFITVRKQNEKMALTALGFYILEAALLATSRIATFSLLRLGQEYVSAGQPVILQTFGSLAFDSMEFVGGTLHMLAFCRAGSCFTTCSTRPEWCREHCRSGDSSPFSRC